jgi:hypothetical protein
MLSPERWKTKPARWPAVVLIGSAGFGVTVFARGLTPAVVGFGLLYFAVILALELIRQELRILTRIARVFFHEEDWTNGELPDTRFIRRLRGEQEPTREETLERMREAREAKPQ